MDGNVLAFLGVGISTVVAAFLGVWTARSNLVENRNARLGSLEDDYEELLQDHRRLSEYAYDLRRQLKDAGIEPKTAPEGVL